MIEEYNIHIPEEDIDLLKHKISLTRWPDEINNKWSHGTDMSFLKELSNCDYKHMEELAPNPDTLKQYRNKDIEWDKFSKSYIENLNVENLSKLLTLIKKQTVVLLCSETEHTQCHRSLLVQELNKILDKEQLKVMNLLPKI